MGENKTYDIRSLWGGEMSDEVKWRFKRADELIQDGEDKSEEEDGDGQE